MTHRTLVLSTFEDYLALNYRGLSDVDKADELAARNERLARFPYSVILQVSYAERDFANRWCWQSMGSPFGECHERFSEYRTCPIDTPHSHWGTWISAWIEKTDYNFGFNDWCFSKMDDQEKFLENLPKVNWGEHYPK